MILVILLEAVPGSPHLLESLQPDEPDTVATNVFASFFSFQTLLS